MTLLLLAHFAAAAVAPGLAKFLNRRAFLALPFLYAFTFVTAILRGDIQMGFDFYAGFQSPIGDRQIRILATSGEHRNPLLKDVPTAVESGLPDYVVTSWNGLASRAGMPEPILRKLNNLIVTALKDPSLQEKALKLGMDARGSTPEQLAALLASEVQRWSAVIQRAGIPKQ